MQPPKLISPKVVTDKTSLSEREQRRKPGFPKAVKLGYGKSGRIAYVEAEIDAWNAARVAERDASRDAGAPAKANDIAGQTGPEPRRPGRPRAAMREAAEAPAARAAAPDDQTQ